MGFGMNIVDKLMAEHEDQVLITHTVKYSHEEYEAVVYSLKKTASNKKAEQAKRVVLIGVLKDLPEDE